ncbi:MAG: GNAT family N-acetyltransferase [Paracoccaceae bacterium]
MIRIAVSGDEMKIEAFLKTRPETSMFLRGNLRLHGLGNTDHPHGTTYFLDESDGEIVNIVGLANGGALMCQFPAASPDFWADIHANLKDRKLSVITGDAAQVGQLKHAFDLSKRKFDLDVTEPLFQLKLSNLRLEDLAKGTLATPTTGQVVQLTDWFCAYRVETLGQSDNENVRREAGEQTKRLIAQNSIKTLVVDGETVSMTSFNAQLPDIVQVGGVYTPPRLRGNKFARTAVALHLSDVRKTGVKTAILFSSNLTASRAYEAIGFKHIGDFGITILSGNQRV